MLPSTTPRFLTLLFLATPFIAALGVGPKPGSQCTPVCSLRLASRSLEVVYLEELARDHVYEFAFIAASLKFRGASAAPFRPIALPLR